MIGKKISHYKILEILGEGGMGIVYKAEDTKLKRHVALKFLPQDLTRDQEAKERFILEAQAASALDHSNICVIHEIDETEDGRTFITMACYEGETLKERIERDPLKLEEAIDIAIQVAQGLEMVHKKGIIHRDIKPGNIFITGDGVAKLLDFGLAKLAGLIGLTTPGTILGTVTYMSPEQAGGEEVDSATDIWSLGVVLYEMLTGKPPFRGEYEQAIIYSILSEDPEPAEKYREDIPVEITTSLNRALQKNPDDRYQSVEEFRVDLQRILDPEAPAVRSISSIKRPVPVAKHNLPIQLTSFVGRGREIAELRELISNNRLVTLTGTGGCGKTRLGLQVAADAIDHFEHGVFFVDLAPLREPSLVLPTVARTLGLQEGVEELSTALKRFLENREILLFLDNFEQVLDAAVEISDLLVSAPRLKVLVTSREPLRVRSERDYAVPPLAVPERSEQHTIQTLSQFESVHLFVERAVAARADFSITDQNAPAVAEICYRLDGLSLAIELAAARVRLFSPELLVKQLANPMKLLTGGARDLPARQQTIRNTIAWSYDMLEEQEQRLFRRLAIFVGGFVLDAVAPVCGGDGPPPLEIDVVDGISSLADKSLLQRHKSSGYLHLTMLETVREFGIERLTEHAEVEQLHQLHCAYYLELLGVAREELHGSSQLEWLARLRLELDNIRATIAWSQARSDDETVIRLYSGSFWFFNVEGLLRERRPPLERACGAASKASAPLWFQGLAMASLLAMITGDEMGAATLFDHASPFISQLSEREAVEALYMLSVTAFYLGRFEEALQLAERSVELSKEGVSPWLPAYPLRIVGLALGRLGQYERAIACFRESLAIVRPLGDRIGTTYALFNWAMVALNHGDYETAGSTGRESLVARKGLSDQFQLVMVLETLATAAAFGEHDAERTARILGAAEMIRREASITVSPSQQKQHEDTVASARAGLGDEAYEKAWDKGYRMTEDEAVDFALQKPRTEPTQPIS